MVEKLVDRKKRESAAVSNRGKSSRKVQNVSNSELFAKAKNLIKVKKNGN